jgi:hypothetical protein
MRNSKLDPILRALVAVDPKHHGLILGAANALKGTDADDVHKRIAQAISADSVPKAKIETQAGTIIHVTRSVPPTYPDWVKEVRHPELQVTGPAEFDLAKLEQWLHEDQHGSNYVRGQVIYDDLAQNAVLESCLGLADLLAIQKLGIKVFRQHFAGKAVFGWKSVVRDRNGYLCVPYLYEDGGQVKLYWNWLDFGWYERYPALRFASQN